MAFYIYTVTLCILNFKLESTENFTVINFVLQTVQLKRESRNGIIFKYF